MSYVDEVYENVVAKNPNEPEFHQAVKEVLDSLRPVIDANEEKYYEAEWEDFLSRGGEVEKFVPASGAASRMFKNLFAFVSAGQEAPSDDFMKSFFEGIEKFAFFPALDAACRKCYGQGVREMLADGRYINVVKCLISDEGFLL